MSASCTAANIANASLPGSTAGGLQIDWAFRVDTLTAVMLVVVTSVSALVHVYSLGYMHDDDTSRAFSRISRYSPSPC
jgi:NADH-quinone oxidoreductase subunit L